MNDRTDELIKSLDLEKHPEGGYFREIYRSGNRVLPDDDREHRSALTTIYFMLASGDRSRWHVVASDEVWHHYEGDVLELLIIDPKSMVLERRLLGPLGGDVRPIHVVPAGCWQAARPTGEYTLVGCTVGPGFDFADFAMIGDDEQAANRLRSEHPDLRELL